MCRNIKTIFNFDPPATEDEVRAASLQYVRKVSGFSRPSRANEEAFEAAVESVSAATSDLLTALTTKGGATESRARKRQRLGNGARNASGRASRLRLLEGELDRLGNRNTGWAPVDQSPWRDESSRRPSIRARSE